MNYYTRSKKYIKNRADVIAAKLENENVKKIKRVIVIIFATLLVLDVVFVMPNPFPTISRVVILSSPKSLFLIWLWGVATANIFFPRKIKNPRRTKIIGFFLLIIITVPLYILGNKLAKDSDKLTCENSTIIPTTFYTEIICYTAYEHKRNLEAEKEILPDEKVDCLNPAEPCAIVRIDLTTPAKGTLIIIGMLFGYLLWPQMEKKPDKDVEIRSASR